MGFTALELGVVALIFSWSGFVRTGLGFGGAALGLPLMMLVGGSPIDWLPIIGIHLFFFSGIALSKVLKKVDWRYLKSTLPWILPAKLLGVIALWAKVPKLLREWAYAGIFFNLLLAIGAHVFNPVNPNDMEAFVPAIPLVMLLVSRYTLYKKEGALTLSK